MKVCKSALGPNIYLWSIPSMNQASRMVQYSENVSGPRLRGRYPLDLYREM